MSDSYRTQKELVLAKRRIKRDSEGNPVFPRIVVKPPTPGDVHPLTKQLLNRLYERIPLEYLYGLRRIELRERRNNEIGRPFGEYSEGEKVITLFSLPNVWRFKKLGDYFRSSLLKFYAEITDEDDGVVVRWAKPEVMTLWFYCDVFAHELGHHFRAKYQHKNGRLGSYNHEELLAELHAKRFTNALFKSYRNSKQTSQ